MKKLISLDIFGFENKELRQEIIGMFSGMTSLYIEGERYFRIVNGWSR